MARLINFTRGEARALLHRLEAGTLADVLTDDEPVNAYRTDWIEEAVAGFVRDLHSSSPFVCVHPEHEVTRRALDLDVLVECVEGSTWVAVHDRQGTQQAASAAYHCLRRAALKICAAFDQPPVYIDVPKV